jgi:serine protease Do
MSRKNPFTQSLKSALATSTVAGMAVVMLATGVPVSVGPSVAEPVRVQAPQAPSFADVVEAVTPAVVSVRVQSAAESVANRSGDGPNFGFRAPGLDNLPEDHPMRRFFREFERGFGDRGDERSERRDERRFGERGGRSNRARPVSQGSGFFISDDGYLVTNNHVVQGGESYTVILTDGTEYTAELIGTDSRTDLAVLKVEEPDTTFTYVDFGNDTDTRVGDWVVAVGNPFGLGGTVTAGIISARGRDIGAGPYDDFIQVDAAVNRGNSGGPTFNLNGEVIGVNTAIFSPSGGNVGIAFAIPANLARAVVNDLIETGSVERGWLGVQIQPVTDDIAESLGLDAASGALVTDPQADGPALAAGIRAGDVVTEVDGATVASPRELARMIAQIRPGTSADLTVWRDGEATTVAVEVGTLPSDQQAAVTPPVPAVPESDTELDQFGLTVVPAEDGVGVVVTDVDSDGPAAERGFTAGDVIISVNDREITSADDIVAAIDEAAAAGRRAALFQLQNEQQNRFVALPIEQG